MICQSCGEKEATIHFTKIEGGEMEEKHLCEDCAKDEEEIGLGVQFSLNDLFGGLLGFNIEGESTKTSKPDRVCDRCGVSYKRILGTGKFGCPDCFINFREDIESLLRSIHGHDEHKGKIPSNTSDRIKKKRKIEGLREELNLSIIEERYEDAAKLRDEIKELEETIEEKTEEDRLKLDSKMDIDENEEKEENTGSDEE